MKLNDTDRNCGQTCHVEHKYEMKMMRNELIKDIFKKT